MIRLFFLFSFVLMLFTDVLAQTRIPFLEKKISVVAENQELSVVLAKIGQAGGFSFSYNPAIGDFSKLVSVRVNQKPVREILQQLLSDYKNTLKPINWTVKAVNWKDCLLALSN